MGIAIAQPKLQINHMTIYPVISLTSGSIGALLPDIDAPNTSLGHKHPFVSKIFKHRGFTHTGIVAASFTALFLLMDIGKVNIATILAHSLMFGFVVGYWSHIIADMFNYKGVPLLWPIIPNRIHLMGVVTGRDIEVDLPVLEKAHFSLSECIFLFSFIVLVFMHVFLPFNG